MLLKLHVFLGKVNFEKSANNNKNMKNYPACKEFNYKQLLSCHFIFFLEINHTGIPVHVSLLRVNL